MSKKTKLETKKIKKHLRVILTKDELLDYGKTQADKLLELNRTEGDQKRVIAEFKAKTSTLQMETNSISDKISSGYEYRDVECTVFFADPKPGKKTIIRNDTNEKVGVEDMTQDELQKELALVEEEAKP